MDIEITGFIGICKNIQKDVVNIDFACRYLGGELATSDESLHVKWVKKDKALNLVTFPLTKKRLGNMLSADNMASCFNFKREPFEVVTEGRYPVGMSEKARGLASGE